MDQDVHDLAVAHALAPTGVAQQKRRLAHGLHAPGHDDLGVAGPDGLGGHDDGLQAGTADHVDRHRRGVLRDAGIGGRLPGRVLTLAGLQHIAHNHLIHFFRANPGATQNFFDDDASQLRGRYVLQGAAKAADGSPHGAGNYYLAHGSSFPKSLWGSAWINLPKFPLRWGVDKFLLE